MMTTASVISHQGMAPKAARTGAASRGASGEHGNVDKVGGDEGFGVFVVLLPTGEELGDDEVMDLEADRLG